VVTILLTHPPQVRENYYSDKALAALQTLGKVRRNPLERELSASELIEAARGCEIIVTHRHVPGDPELFAGLPGLVAFCRCAIDIRGVDVAAASAHGVLVTQASAGFIPATAEWALGAMIDLGRRISFAAEAYHAGRVPDSIMGQQLHGATLGVIGYGSIDREETTKIEVAEIFVQPKYAACEGDTQCADNAKADVALLKLKAAIPDPKADQEVPFQSAMLLALTPPAVVKSPAAQSLLS